MINPRQKMLLHVYKEAAGLPDPVYRDHLRHAAGVASAADRAMTQAGFESCMAALETVLFVRVHAGDAPNPIGRNRFIQAEFYWRHKLPRQGKISSRQAYMIEQLWTRLQEYLAPESRNLAYLAGITRKATGKTDPGHTCFTAAEADALINALKDRLSYAIKSTPVDAVV